MKAKTSTEVRPKRWFRFSLRSAMLAATIAGILLGSLAVRYNQSIRQAAAVEALTAAGANVQYDDWQVIDERVSKRQERVPRGPEWLRRPLGPHFFDRVIKVSFHRTKPEVFSEVAPKLRDLRHLRSIRMWSLKDLSNDQFAFIGDMQGIEELECGFMEINEQRAAQIARSRGLRSITFKEAELSLATLRAFRVLPHLEKFRHESPTIRNYDTDGLNDQTIKAFAEFPQLRDLSLFGTVITNNGMKTLCELTKLEKLVIGSRLVTGEAMDHVSNLKRLETLGTWGWKLKDDDLTKLPKMPSLKQLDLLCAFKDPHACLTDKAPATIAEMPQLTFLRVRGIGVTDHSLPLLHGMTNLSMLDLDNTSVDSQGEAVKQLRAALPGCATRLPATDEEMKQQFNDWKYGQRTFQK